MLKLFSNLCLIMMGTFTCLAFADMQVFVKDSKGQPVSNAVVLLKSDALIAKSAALKNAEVAQQNREFVPGVAVVTVGTPVDFPNRDDVRHHVYSFSPAKTFELKLYAGKPESPIIFDQPGIIELGCNIHDSMLGWVVVSDTPIFEKTDQGGQLTFAAPTNGAYTLSVWHKDFPYGAPFVTKDVTVSDANTVFEVQIPAVGEAF